MNNYYTRLCPHSQGYHSTICIACGGEFVFCPKCFRTEPDFCEECEKEADQSARKIADERRAA